MRFLGLQSLSYPHGKATPGKMRRGREVPKMLRRPRKKVAPKKIAKAASKRFVLVGTYAKGQLERWQGYYNYPLFGKDKIDIEAVKGVNELWLFSGAKEPRYFAAECLGVKTRAELKEFGYKQSGRGHGSGKYILFKIKNLYAPSRDFAESVIIRTKDFAGQGATQKQLKQYLESPDRRDPLLAKRLPTIVTELPRERLRVCETAVQLYFWNMPNMRMLEPKVPFPSIENPKFTFIDLFAGIGGFRIAMQRCGGKCVFTSEFDAYAQKTYEANFGDVPAGDITKQETHDLIPEKFDVVCAGFPCQAFSLAGKRLGFKDLYKGMSRGTLFAEVVKICEKHRPKAVFCENVKGLFIHDKGNTFKIIKSEFEAIGYKFFYKILNSKDFGVPQHRERIYMVAFREDYASDGYEFEFPKPTGTNLTLNDIRERNVSARYFLSDVYVETLKRHRARHEAAGHGFGYVIRDWNGTSGAIVCGGMGRETNLLKEENGTPKGLVPETHIKGAINKEGIRKMTPREWARLQGFPENFKFVLSDVHLYKQFGNSVSIPVIEAISKNIVSHIKQVDACQTKGVIS